LRPETNFLLVDGLTAAKDLRLDVAVPARVTVHTDGKRRAVTPDKLVIEFKQAAPGRLQPIASAHTSSKTSIGSETLASDR
jgi:hypothetical protein